MSPNQSNSNVSYTKNISQHLLPRELFVSLLVNENDKIYVKASLNFKNKNMVGFAKNVDEPNETVLTFMISSCFEPFKEIVRLCPVKSIKGKKIKEFTYQVMEFVHKSDFTIVQMMSTT